MKCCRACAVLNPRWPPSLWSHLAPVPRREISGKLSEVVGSCRKAIGNFRKGLHHPIMHCALQRPPHQGRHYSPLPGLHVRTQYSVPGAAILRTDTQPRGRYIASLHEVPEVDYSDGLYYSPYYTRSHPVNTVFLLENWHFIFFVHHIHKQQNCESAPPFSPLSCLIPACPSIKGMALGWWTGFRGEFQLPCYTMQFLREAFLAQVPHKHFTV